MYIMHVYNNNRSSIKIFYSILFYCTSIALNFVRKQILRRSIANPLSRIENTVEKKQRSSPRKADREPSQQLCGKSLAKEVRFKFLTETA